MSKSLSCLVLLVTAIACGGTTDSGGDSGGGTSSGGTSSAGHGGNASAGKATGGSVGTGGSSTVGGGSSGGSSAGGAGGAGTYDPRCPAHLPSGSCGATDNGLKCEYDNFTGCLCYESAPGTFGICQKVDPTCMMATAGGTGGAAAAPPPAPGAGGVSAKVALPPHEVCSCNAGTWACTFGF